MTGEERKVLYSQLCTKGKIHSLFMQPWWLDATGDWDVSLAVRNGQIVGAMPFSITRKWGIRKIGMPDQTHHLRIWMEKPPDVSHHKWLTREKQIIWLLIDDLPPHGLFSMVFEEGSFDNWLPFHWKGFRQEMRYTFVIERTSPEELDQQLNRNLKRSLRHEGYKVRLTREVGAEDFYRLCQDTYRRQKTGIPFSRTWFSRLDAAITRHDAGIKLGMVNPSGQLIAVSYLLWDTDRAYYFLAGDNAEGRNTGASIVLCRHALRIAFEEKQLPIFDFCGSMIESITEMRRQFGAKSVGLMKIYKAKSKLLNAIYLLTR
jgi:hypothetical protein